ncbi:MAG: hypothetical protein B7C24_06855 [Bacteroidetes bacterium 4572_77]|nr:MAG: hypothetical protein B7C24_06855 [Bacteroidetes bacterium 4572_77]
MKIGFVVKGLTFFKAFGSIIEEAQKTNGITPIIFYYTGDYSKKYDCIKPHLFPERLSGIKKIAFNSCKSLPRLFKRYDVRWFVGLVAQTKYADILSPLKAQGIKICSVSNFTDGFWINRVTKNAVQKIDLMCYQSKYALDFHKKYLGINGKNCIIAGAPTIDGVNLIKDKQAIKQYGLPKKYCLVMLPNIRKTHYKSCFGGTGRFIGIMKNLHEAASNQSIQLVAKSRVKQWFPKEVKKYFARIILDEAYYPSTTLLLMHDAINVVYFNGSSIFEAFACGKYAININMNMNYSIGSRSKGFAEYYSKNGPYNTDGVVKTISGDIIDEIRDEMGKQLNSKRSAYFAQTFCPTENSAKIILSEILKR